MIVADMGGRGFDPQSNPFLKNRGKPKLIKRGLMLIRTEGVHGIYAILNHIMSSIKSKRAFKKLGYEKVILLNSVHRSGSTWLSKMIDESTGLPNWQPEFLRRKHPHCIEIDDIKKFTYRAFITKLHIPKVEPTLSAIEDMNCKILFLYRDLRDVAVSWSHYILSRSHTPEYKKLRLTKETAISEMIDHYINFQLHHDCYQIKEWLATPDELVYKIRFSELKKDPQSTLQEIIEFIGFGAKGDLINVVQRNKIKNGPKIRKNINRGRTRGGKSGQWKKVFTIEQEKKLDAVAKEILHDYPSF